MYFSLLVVRFEYPQSVVFPGHTKFLPLLVLSCEPVSDSWCPVDSGLRSFSSAVLEAIAGLVHHVDGVCAAVGAVLYGAEVVLGKVGQAAFVAAKETTILIRNIFSNTTS